MELPVKQVGSDGVSRFYFDSLSHICEVAIARNSGRCGGGKDTANDLCQRRDAWTERLTTADVLAQLSNPPTWLTDALADAKRELEEHVAVPQQLRRRVRHGLEDGDELDVTAWLYRNPDGWTDTLKEKTTKRVIKIGVNVSVNCHIVQSQLTWRGAVAAALSDIFNELGHAVEIVTFQADQHFARDIWAGSVTNIMTKPAGSPMDLSAVAMACCSISFFRCVMLPAKCRLVEREPEYNLGQADRLKGEDIQGFDVIIDGDVFSKEQAIARAKAVLAEFTQNV